MTPSPTSAPFNDFRVFERQELLRLPGISKKRVQKGV
jgi:hypothetical protein